MEILEVVWWYNESCKAVWELRWVAVTWAIWQLYELDRGLHPTSAKSTALSVHYSRCVLRGFINIGLSPSLQPGKSITYCSLCTLQVDWTLHRCRWRWNWFSVSRGRCTRHSFEIEAAQAHFIESCGSACERNEAFEDGWVIFNCRSQGGHHEMVIAKPLKAVLLRWTLIRGVSDIPKAAIWSHIATEVRHGGSKYSCNRIYWNLCNCFDWDSKV